MYHGRTAMDTLTNKIAEREKKRVALASVFAAIFLTGMKLVVGILTNSLGILSEAAHSGLDLVAAGVTYFAVRVSDQPPDLEHPYGHGKVENFSALIETLLLLITCVWIVYEAISRLINHVEVEVTLWSFIVMVTSIVVDVNRSRLLMKAAKKHNSQALEADALHFSTDVWSSSVVIAGLISVWLAEWLQRNTSIRADWLLKADAVAALGVSAIVVYVSVQLGRRTINALLDTTSKDEIQKVEQSVMELPGVSAVRRVRVRHSGPTTFVDIRLAVPRSDSLEQANRTASQAQETVQQLFPQSDVMVHLEPVVEDEHSLVEHVWSVAARHGVRAHSIRAQEVLGRLSVSIHVEVPEHLTLDQAHERVSAFEGVLRHEVPELEDIVTHIEPVGDSEARRPSNSDSSEVILKEVKNLPNQVPGVKDCHTVSVFREGNELSVSFHCTADADLPISHAHRLTIELENLLRTRLPDLGHVVIHLEPYRSQDQ
jgi:cation diffusion facilitator family transporter